MCNVEADDIDLCNVATAGAAPTTVTSSRGPFKTMLSPLSRRVSTDAIAAESSSCGSASSTVMSAAMELKSLHTIANFSSS